MKFAVNKIIIFFINLILYLIFYNSYLFFNVIVNWSFALKYLLSYIVLPDQLTPLPSCLKYQHMPYVILRTLALREHTYFIFYSSYVQCLPFIMNFIFLDIFFFKFYMMSQWRNLHVQTEIRFTRFSSIIVHCRYLSKELVF